METHIEQESPGSNYQSEDVEETKVEREDEQNEEAEVDQENKGLVAEQSENYRKSHKEGKRRFALEGEEEEESEYGSEKSSVLDYISVESAVSFELDHQRYEFSVLRDPGTIENIFAKKQVNLPEDEFGRTRYLRFCQDLRIPLVVRFYNALLTNEIDLTYHGINQRQMRAMCAALETNNNVKKYVFRGNILSKECCSYLSLLLPKKNNIVSLDLTDCRIGSKGASYLALGLKNNEGLRELKLSKNNILDEGMWSLSDSLKRHTFIEMLVLSHNKLGTGAAEALGTIFSTNSSIKFLNLDHNNLYDPIGMKKLFKGLIFNKAVTDLYLRWNSISELEVVEACAQFFRRNRTILCMDLSDNRLDGASITPFNKGLASTQSLATLRLARNPLTSADVEYILPALRTSSIELLDLQEIWVRKEFMKSLEKIQLMRDIKVIIGGVYSNYTVRGPDYAEIILKRAKFEAMKPKTQNARKDFGQFMILLGDEPLTPEQFMIEADKFKAKVSQELYSELLKQFILPKNNVVDVVQMREKYFSIFPNNMLSKKKN